MESAACGREHAAAAYETGEKILVSCPKNRGDSYYLWFCREECPERKHCRAWKKVKP